MNERWFFAKNGQKCGPVSRDVIVGMLGRGELQPNDMVLRDGGSRWVTALSLWRPPSPAAPPPAASAAPPPREPLAGTPGDMPPPSRPLRRIGLACLRVLVEVPWACGAALAQTGRLLWYWRTKRKTARVAHLSRRTQIELGQALALARLGDARLCSQLAAVEQRLPAALQANEPVREIEKERDHLLRQLAYPWLKSAPPRGLESEHQRAVETVRERKERERSCKRAREGLFPASKAGKARVGAGYVLLGAAAYLAVVLLLPARDSSAPGGANVTGGPKQNGGSPNKNPEQDTDTAPSGKDKDATPPSKRPFGEQFPQLALAVPLIEVPGAGSGAGFLVRHDGRYLVVTNRHVIENAQNGVEVHFLQPGATGMPERRTVPKGKARVVAVHRTADLAVIDVSAEKENLAKWKVQPLVLAPRDTALGVGTKVFAISPSDDAPAGPPPVKKVVAVGRTFKALPGTFAEVTVPIKPNNSGGPIFNEQGEVVAVATFVIPRAKDKDNLKEGTNLGLDVRFVHEILSDPARSLTAKEIAALFEGVKPASQPLRVRMEAQLKTLRSQGYQPSTGDLKTSVIPFKLKGLGDFSYPFENVLSKDRVAVFVVSKGSTDVSLYVYDPAGKLVKKDARDTPDPMVTFEAPAPGEFRLVVSNETVEPAEGLLVLLLKT